MALLAVFLDGKCGFTVVTGSARCALFHGFHGGPSTVFIGIQLGVAITALVGTRMKIVAEVADNGAVFVAEDNIGRFCIARMALDAVTLDGKGGFAVVAGSAGISPLHVSHGGPFILFPVRLDNTGMTFLAAIY